MRGRAATPRPYALALTVVAGLLLFRFKLTVLKTLGICGRPRLAAGMLGGPLT